MFTKACVGVIGIGAVGLATCAQAAVLSSLVKADLSGGVGSTPRLTTADNGTDPHAFGVNVNVTSNVIDGIGLFNNVLSSSEYLGGSGISGGGGIAASGGDTTSNTSATNGLIPRNFTAPATTAGTLTVTGFAFASGANVGTSPLIGANRAATLRLAVLWFGADGAAGGSGANADTYLTNGVSNFIDVDATIYRNDTSDGTSSGTQNSGAYYVQLNPSDYLTLAITTNNGTTVSNRFRVELRPETGDTGSLRLKTNSSTNTTFADARFAVAGTFEATPEPASLSVLALGGASLLRRQRPKTR